ncbi:hypothetical protein BGW80DRAFT_1462364 [Lactifluus volemus]|nr:hypothetical protein BGW80DRAFT_1462364 [Lactifluus volemus]
MFISISTNPVKHRIGITGARMPKKAIHYFWIANPSQSATSLHGRTPVRKSLNVWPQFPLAIDFYNDSEWPADNPEDSLDNLVAALEYCDRVCQINITSPAWEEIVAAMEEPFPALTYLYINSLDVVVPLPDIF